MSLKWIFELVDKVTAPARTMEKSVQQVDKALGAAGKHADEAMKKVGHGADEASGSVKRMAESMEHLKKAAETVGLIYIFEKATELAEALFDKMKEFGAELFGAADFERSSLITFKALTGSAEAAERIAAGAKAFAIEAGTPIKETMQAYRNLLMGTVAEKNIPILLQAATDLASIRGEGASGIAAYAQAFGDIQSSGVLNGRALAQFKGLLDFGVLSKKITGVKGDFKSLQKALEETPLSAAKGLRAILETLAEQEGGKIGQVTKDIGQGWAGAIEKLRTRWDLFLGEFANSSAFQHVLELLDRVGNAFDQKTETGRRMTEVFERLFKAIDDALKPLLTPEGMDRFIKQLERVASALGAIASTTVKIGGWMAKSPDDINERPDVKAYNKLPLWKRLTTPNPAFYPEGKVPGGGPALDVPPRSPPSGSAGGRESPSGTTHHRTIQQYFTIHADRSVDEGELARRLHELSSTELQSPFDHMAASMGNP
jgi:hypothetical protein